VLRGARRGPRVVVVVVVVVVVASPRVDVESRRIASNE